MDVNGTRHHLLFGKEDWSRCSGPSGLPVLHPASGSGCDWNDRYQTLILKPLPFTFRGGAASKKLTLKDRRGAAVDRFGNWFRIDDDEKRICVKLSGSGAIVRLWSAAEPASGTAAGETGDFSSADAPIHTNRLKLRGLAITDDHHLAAGTLDPAGILLFDLYSRTPPRHLLFPHDAGIAPFDCSPAPGGGIWLLDRKIEAGAHWRLFRIDGNFFVAGTGRKNPTGSGRHTGFDTVIAPASFPYGITTDSWSGDAVAVESLPDGSAVVLVASDFPCVFRCSMDRSQRTYTLRKLAAGTVPCDPRDTDYWTSVLPYDCAFSGSLENETVSGSLFIVTGEGNQAFRFAMTDTGADGEYALSVRPEYYPLRLFGGKGIVTGRDGVYYDFEASWVPLTNQAKPRFEHTGEFITEPLDGGETDCVWHRFLLDADIRPETSVTVFSRASNSSDALAHEQWHREPGPYKRGSGTEMPYVNNTSPAVSYGTWELLFQRAKGRFVQLRCILTGDGRTSPLLRALRVHYPRFSYLHRYLPSVYREDQDSALFLDRFLANFEGIFTSIEDRIAAVQMLADYRSAPAEALEWLAGWLSVAFDPSWDQKRRRLFIHNAPVFFAYRGTMKGMLMALRLGFGNNGEKSISDAIFNETKEHAQITGRIRIDEHFAHRVPPLFTVPAELPAPGPSSIDLSKPWSPAEGGKAVSSRYRAALAGYFGIDRIQSKVRYPLSGPLWQTMDEKLSIGQTSCTPLMEEMDTELFPGYLTKYGNESGTADDDTVPLSISYPGLRVPTVDEWNRYIGRKALVWQQFSLDTFGFIPSYFIREWNNWIRFITGRYASIEKLNTMYGTTYDRFVSVPWPSDKPEASAGADWNAYVRETGHDSGAINRLRWTRFCARRYCRIRVLNDAYGTHWDSFEQIPLPYTVPTGGARLSDWYLFESTILPMHAAAHRFKVSLPLQAESCTDPIDAEKRIQLAERIIDIQKPAHTVFDVGFYWASFVVGKARLGADTVVDNSTRPPYFLTRMILSHGHLAESYLDSPYRIRQRSMVAGITRVQEKAEFFPMNGYWEEMQNAK